MKLCGKEFTPEEISQIREIIAENQDISRRQLSRQVCERLNWRSANGKLKEMSCRVALLRMQRQGVIKLPPVQGRSWLDFLKGSKAKHQSASKEKAGKLESEAIECELPELGEIKIIKVSNRFSKSHQTWKEMMNRYHYLGSGSLCGYQMRYLIESERYGYIGGLAFSSSAWRLESRDKWIGWDEERRQEGLSKVVGNSRFLIVPYVRVKNLASYALSQSRPLAYLLSTP